LVGSERGSLEAVAINRPTAIAVGIEITTQTPKKIAKVRAISPPPKKRPYPVEGRGNTVRGIRVTRPQVTRRSCDRPPLAALDGSDPLLAIESEVAVGDHSGCFLERELGLLDQERGLASGSTYLRAARVKGCRAGRVAVGEAPAATDELETVGLPGAGVGGVLKERGECLGKLGDPVTLGSRRSTSHGAYCMTAPTRAPWVGETS
jgi:hypothetical protein